MIDRRQFASLLALSGFAATTAGAAGKKIASPPPKAQPRLPPAPVKPRRLAEGDTVGMILPATLEFEPSLIDLGREQLEALGLKVKIGAHARDKVGSFAGTDRDRAADIH